MNPAVVMLAVCGIGLLSGFRTFTPLALVSWMALWGWTPLAGAPFWFIGTQLFAFGISILALLELVGDKLPRTPPRIHLMPLVARFVAGSVAAGALSFSAGRWWLPGSFLGGISAIAGAFTGYYSRRALVKGVDIPDVVVALTEDFITIAGTLFLVHRFFHTAV